VIKEKPGIAGFFIRGVAKHVFVQA